MFLDAVKSATSSGRARGVDGNCARATQEKTDMRKQRTWVDEGGGGLKSM